MGVAYCRSWFSFRDKQRSCSPWKETSKFADETSHDQDDSKIFTEFFDFCTFVVEYERVNGIAEHSNRSTSSRQMKEPSSYSTEALQHRPPRPPQQHSDGGSDELSDEEDTDEDSSASESTDKDSQLVYTSDDESWSLVTCYCQRPFAGRPMIECSKCLTWIHLSCANIRKSNVPEVFVCQQCGEADVVRRSKRRKHQ